MYANDTAIYFYLKVKSDLFDKVKFAVDLKK